MDNYLKSLHVWLVPFRLAAPASKDQAPPRHAHPPRSPRLHPGSPRAEARALAAHRARHFGGVGALRSLRGRRWAFEQRRRFWHLVRAADTPFTSAWPPSLPSVPTSLATRVTSAPKELS